jgi:hypothetical protein
LEPAFQSTLPVTAAAAWLYGCTYTEMIRLELETGNLRRRAEDVESAIACRRAHLQGSDFQPRDFSLKDGRIVK